MANITSHVTLAFGVGRFCNEPDKIPRQLELLEAAREGNIKMLDTSRIYVCYSAHRMAVVY
jgi:hypothetical protein